MAKQNKNRKTVEDIVTQKPAPEPKFTRAGYQISLWVIIVGLIAQLVMAVVVYPTLPSQIPSWWIGQLVRGDTVPAWTVFAVFPVGQLALLLTAVFSPRDKDGRPVMETGKAWTLTVLAALFTALQASSFNLPKA